MPIPLPALQVAPPVPQANPLEQYGQLLQLKNALANAPLQRQALQQQVEAGAQENQMRALQIKDQQATTAAMQNWDGKDLQALPSLMIKNGASAQAVMGLKAKILEQQQAYSKIAADDATTGAKNLDTLKSKNDMLNGKLSAVTALPDDQIAQGVTQAAQEAAQAGILDPQHAQAAQQLAQLPPDQIRAQLGIMQKGLMSQSQQIEQAAKQASTAASVQETKEKQAAANWYAQNGGAPGVSAELIQQSDWLKKNPGKGPSDYKLWVMQHSPSAMVMGNQLGGQQNDPALDFAANNYRLTGQLPAGFSRSPGTTSAIISRAAQLDQQAGGGGIAANKADVKSLSESLAQLQKNFQAVSAFENTANKNIDMLKGLAAKVPDLGTRFANTPVRAISGSVIGSENMAAFKTALAPVQTEAAKILNSANLTGQLSDSARKELQDIIDGNVPYKSLVASLNVLQQDFKNRHDSYQQQISDIQGRLKGLNSGQQPAAPPAAPQGGNVIRYKIVNGQLVAQ